MNEDNLIKIYILRWIVFILIVIIATLSLISDFVLLSKNNKTSLNDYTLFKKECYIEK